MATNESSVSVGGYSPERLGKRVTSVLAIVALWEVLTLIGFPTLPEPVAVGTRLLRLLGTVSFWNATVLSVVRIALAFALAVVTAVPLGLFMGWSEPFSDLTFPSFEMLRPIPPIAWLPASILIMPILDVWFFIGTFEVKTNVIFIAFLGAFFPILLNTIDGVTETDTTYSQAARSLGADRWNRFRHVLLPGALPSIHTGMVVGMGLAWVNLVAAEMIAGSGLGYLTWSSYTAGDYPVIIVGMISIGILGFVSSTLIRRLGNQFLAWEETNGR